MVAALQLGLHTFKSEDIVLFSHSTTSVNIRMPVNDVVCVMKVVQWDWVGVLLMHSAPIEIDKQDMPVFSDRKLAVEDVGRHICNEQFVHQCIPWQSWSTHQGLEG